MNRDMLLLCFSLLSWGWLSETWPAAFGLLLAIAISKYSAWRWRMSSRQFYRCGDLSALLALLMLADAYILQPTERPIFVLLKWLPAVFAPMLLAQLFSSAQALPLATLLYSLRKSSDEFTSKLPYTALYHRESGVIRLFREIDFILPYAALTVLSAGAANVQSPAYFIIATMLFTGILWPVRPKHSPLPIWLLCIGLAVATGHYGYHGLERLNSVIEEKALEWLGNWQTDPFKGQTSIGDVGELKLSDQIQFRVKADQPLLLHQASYDVYLGHNWTASAKLFTHKNPVSDSGKLHKLEILQQLDQQSVLALPDGTAKITGLDDAELLYTELGAIKARLTPRFARYQVFYSGKRIGAPSKLDLQVPTQHLDWLQQVHGELKLAGQRPEAIAERIKTHFQRNFFYSLYLGSQTDSDLALREFMLKRKAGHCEYFAVATVLLLRQAGIPARLSSGYAVDEYDSRQSLYIVRSRHAHAWATAYINGLWQAVDSTPPQWLAMETQHASLWQPLTDWWSNCVFYFSQWQFQQSGQNAKLELLAALLLVIYLALRIFAAKGRLKRNAQFARTAELETCYPGFDSEFYLIEQCLKNTALARRHNESAQQWIGRLQIPALDRLYQLHYRLRFDPRGLSAEQRQQLQQQAKAWTDDFKNNRAKH
jgi:hypothetical protein